MSPALLALSLLLLPPVDEDIVARGEGVVLTRAQFSSWLVDRVGFGFVNEFVTEHVVLQAAQDAGLLPSEEAVDEAAAARRSMIIAQFYKGDEEDYLADLRAKGLDPATHEARQRAETRYGLALEALARQRQVVTEEDVRRLFRARYGEDGEHVAVEVLFFDAYHGLQPGEQPPPIAELKAGAAERARAAREAWAAGAALEALLPGADPVRSVTLVEGRLDPYQPNLLGPEVEQAVSSLDEPGQLSPPIPVWNGTFVVRLAARDAVALDDVREDLERSILEGPLPEELLSRTREELLTAAGVEVLLR